MRGNWWGVYRNDMLVAKGFGDHGQLQEGETVKWFDDRAALDADPTVIKARLKKTSLESLESVSTQNRAQAYALKTLCARQFLREVPETDDDFIDPELYPELHHEYEALDKEGDRSPWDLARKIRDNAQKQIDSEIDTRKIERAAKRQLKDG